MLSSLIIWGIFLGSGGFGVWGKEISSRGGRCVSAPFVSQMGDWLTVLPALLCLYSLVTRLGCLVGWALRMPDLTPINWQVPNWTLVDSSHAARWWPPLASILVLTLSLSNKVSGSILDIQWLIWFCYIFYLLTSLNSCPMSYLAALFSLFPPKTFLLHL